MSGLFEKINGHLDPMVLEVMPLEESDIRVRSGFTLSEKRNLNE